MSENRGVPASQFHRRVPRQPRPTQPNTKQHTSPPTLLSRSVQTASVDGLCGRSTRKRSTSTGRPVDPSRVVEGDRLRVERPQRLSVRTYCLINTAKTNPTQRNTHPIQHYKNPTLTTTPTTKSNPTLPQLPTQSPIPMCVLRGFALSPKRLWRFSFKWTFLQTYK